MKYYDLDKEEQEVLEGIEAGDLNSAPNLPERKRELKAYAKIP